jgi:hypothetical protein
MRLINDGPFELSSLLSTKAQRTSRSQVITWACPRRRFGERRLGRQSGSFPTSSQKINVGRALILFLFNIFDGCLVSTTRMTCGRCCWLFVFEILVNAILELGDRLANNQENLVDVCICGVLERIEPRQGHSKSAAKRALI